MYSVKEYEEYIYEVSGIKKGCVEFISKEILKDIQNGDFCFEMCENVKILRLSLGLALSKLKKRVGFVKIEKLFNHCTPPPRDLPLCRYNHP